MKPINVDALDAFSSLSVQVQLRNLWRVRLGLWLLSLAARVLRCGVEVNEVEISSGPAE
jgi:hypothetical protein